MPLKAGKATVPELCCLAFRCHPNAAQPVLHPSPIYPVFTLRHLPTSPCQGERSGWRISPLPEPLPLSLDEQDAECTRTGGRQRRLHTRTQGHATARDLGVPVGRGDLQVPSFHVRRANPDWVLDSRHKGDVGHGAESPIVRRHPRPECCRCTLDPSPENSRRKPRFNHNRYRI